MGRSLYRFCGTVWCDVLLCLMVLILIFLACGCSGHRGSNVPDSLPAVGSSVERTGAHVESAERLNNAAKPMAGPAAVPLMDQVSAEHGAALNDLDAARKEINSARQQRDKLEDDNAKLNDRLVKVMAGWGYRLQVFVTRVFWIAVATAAGLVAMGFAGLMIGGPIGGTLLKVAGIPAALLKLLANGLHPAGLLARKQES